MDKIERIAAALTPGQELALKGAKRSHFGLYFLPARTHYNTRRSLVDKGLCSRRPSLRLLTLGVRVHEHLVAREARQ